LLSDAARTALVSQLLPVATLVTPNAPEAEALAGFPVRSVADARRAAKAIAALGPKAVLVKGGHLHGGDATDVLFHQGAWLEFTGPRVDTRHTHGTGCTLSAAITARLASGASLSDSVQKAKTWLTEALRTAPGLGHGIGPVNHFAPTAE
ncbi:MAG: bifunctional hydroxymethylpyrimidine kinase/phosphomethylpyrimidine kinase, partial [Archangium sp.]|nr:bifunctional hydroxymethylpyrimidine kinase/phosphomethylpyrimidine kinase [Archangium sp.]